MSVADGTGQPSGLHPASINAGDQFGSPGPWHGRSELLPGHGAGVTAGEPGIPATAPPVPPATPMAGSRSGSDHPVHGTDDPNCSRRGPGRYSRPGRPAKPSPTSISTATPVQVVIQAPPGRHAPDNQHPLPAPAQRQPGQEPAHLPAAITPRPDRAQPRGRGGPPGPRPTASRCPALNRTRAAASRAAPEPVTRQRNRRRLSHAGQVRAGPSRAPPLSSSAPSDGPLRRAPPPGRPRT